MSCRICSLGCREDVNKSMPRESWYNRPFRPVESFSPHFLAWIMTAMCGMKPTWKRRVVKTLFLPFDPFYATSGLSPWGDDWQLRTSCPSSDDWQLETPRFSAPFPTFRPCLTRPRTLCPWSDHWQLETICHRPSRAPEFFSTTVCAYSDQRDAAF